MKRAVIFLLALSVLAGAVLSAGAEDACTLPEPLKTVSANAEGLDLPGSMPPFVQIRSFHAENGEVHLELEDAVPRLKIMEQHTTDGAESTIFTKKNASSADAHAMGRDDDSRFVIRMIWSVDGLEFVREYVCSADRLTFRGYTASETTDAAAFAPYTSAVRTLSFTEQGDLISETWTLENKKDRLVRVAAYDEDGALLSVSQSWESVKSGDYRYILETDRSGSITGLSAETPKNTFFAESLLIGENPDAVGTLSDNSVDSGEFEDQLEEKYPQLENLLFGESDDDWDDWDDDDDGVWDPDDSDDEDPDDEDSEDSDDPDDEEDPDEPDDPDDEEDSGDPEGSEDAGNGQESPAEDENGKTRLVPAGTRVWSLNFKTYFDEYAYAFVADEPPILLRDGKAVLNSKGRDVSGKPFSVGKNKIAVPVMESVTVR